MRINIKTLTNDNFTLDV